MTDRPSVALIGAGAMGGALLKGWLAAGSIDPACSAVFDPNIKTEMAGLCAQKGVAVNKSEGPFDAMVLAVKPQAAADVLPQYAAIAKESIVISVMAGKSVASIVKMLNGAPRVARVMPNLPAAIGKGVSGLYAPDAIDAQGRAVIETLMRAAGETVWVRTEQEIDFVTAVSGSGPAYFFLLTEALADAGAALGLDKDAAAALARATLAGAGAMMEADARSPAEMRKAVTSPGGTTEAALKVFDGDDAAMRKLVKAAVEAAAKRAGELTD
ncbi:pyrroline-5-carboxylate reductase [Hyphococcus sp.]|uniref:pyrroline-5-carboxylate reductase n=1 Tax=Hyphococcus sp. TaxID=2038636 RepID=UPI003D0FF3B6